MTIFTLKELQEFNLDQLHRIANWYQLEVVKDIELQVNIVWEHVNSIKVSDDSENIEQPKYSARLRRILERKKGEKDE